MKHSWSEMFSNTGDPFQNNNVFNYLFLFISIYCLGEILVYLLPLTVTDTISFARFGIGGMEKEIEQWGSDLSSIEVEKKMNVI